MKYPFSPEFLDALPESIAQIYRDLEMELIDYICGAIGAGGLNEKSVQDIRILRSHGIPLEPIERAIREAAGLTKRETDKLFRDVVARNEKYYDGVLDMAKLTAPEELVTEAQIDALIAQTEGELANITGSMGFMMGANAPLTPPARVYQTILDEAAIGVQAGTSYTTAIERATRKMAANGLRYVNYESGHVDHADVAVRRAIMTGTAQICDKYTVATAKKLNSHYYEVSAHAGARDTGIGWQNHKEWQGKVYSDRDGDKYPSIYEVCGLDEVDGLEGVNCRHRRFVFIEGLSTRTYTDEELANIDPPPFEYQGKTYNAYQATQKQREIERTMRRLKREEAALRADGFTEDAAAVKANMRRLSKEYTEFSKAAHLPEQRVRMKVIE